MRLKKRSLFILLPLLWALFISLAQADEDLQKPIDHFYHWANATYGQNHTASITPEALKANLSAIFAPDIVHYLNGKKVAASVPDLYARFLKLDHKYRSVDVLLPYDDIVIDPIQHKVAIQYRIRFILPDGHEKLLHAQTIFAVRQGKITQFNEISAFEGDHL